MKKNLIALSLLVVGGLGLGLMLTQPAEAIWPFSSNNNTQITPIPRPRRSDSLIETIINKFNLNRDQVYQVVDQYRTDRLKERQEYLQERLDQAVKDGVITSDQKQALLDKMTERYNERLGHIQEMHEWMEENDLDFMELRKYLGPGMGRGFGMGMMRGF